MAGRRRADISTKFVPEVRNRILEALRAGNTRSASCRYAGLTYRAFCKWLVEGRKKKARPEFLAFLESVEKAEADAVIRNVATIQKAAQKQWQAAAWWLERKFPEEWAAAHRTIQQLKERVKALEDQQGGPIHPSLTNHVDPQSPGGPPA